MKNKKGFSLVELLIAIAFISVIVVLVFGIAVFNNKLRKVNEERTQALLYANQSLEAIKLISWVSLAAGDYHLEVQGDTWDLISGSELIDNKYTRTITISDVYRASSTTGLVYGPIVETGGYVDADTKKITATIDWMSKIGIAKQDSLETYVYLWDTERWTQTNWVGGSGQTNWLDETMFASKDSGIVISTPGVASLTSGFIDWSYATTTDIFDTPGNFDDNDVYELNGVAYLVTKNNPAGAELYVIDVSDPYNPFELSTLDIGDSVTSVVALGQYAYVSTADNAGEFKVIDISNDYNPQVVFSYDLPTNDDASDITVNENEAYISQGNNMYSFNITNPTAPLYLDSVTTSDIIAEILVAENHVYMATRDDNMELQITDVTNPINMQIVTQYDLPGSLKGSDIDVRGTRVYISTENNGSGEELFLFDISDPLNPVAIGAFEMGETIHSFSIIGPYALLGTNFLDQELVIVDISNPGVMIKVAGFDLKGYVLGMSANCSIIYAATSSNEAEFFIISTEVVDCNYADYGILESSTYDTGSSEVTYNWIAWTGTAPENTSIRFQLASSNSQSGPWSYVGPDGTNTSYYTVGAKEFINYSNHLNHRYIRYKLFLASQAEFTVPILEEITISYTVN